MASPTVVLVHGAFSDASGYAGVIGRLQSEGLAVRAPANPLRGLASDTDAVARYANTIDGPVLLVGHSYGGAVITQAAPAIKDVAGLVFLSAFALDEGESCASVQEPFPPTLAAMAVSQRPLSAAAITENATLAGWKQLPSWYLVSEQDNAIPPDAERFMAKRIGAVTETVDGSHAAFIARPDVASALILSAVAGA